MKRWITVAMALVVTVITVGAAASQEMTDEQRRFRAHIEDQYNIVPLPEGVALTPKARGGPIRIIEVSEGEIAINGLPLSGRELKKWLGNDSEPILWLSYLSADRRRELFAGAGAQGSSRTQTRRGAEQGPTFERRSSGERVRIFGDVTVEQDEHVGGNAVAVIGSVRVNGEVGEQVVAVLGSIDLGPKSVVSGDVVSVGGRIRRAPGAQVRGNITEISLGDAGAHISIGPWFGPIDAFGGIGVGGVQRLLGSTFRMLLLALLAGIALVVARGSVERSAERVMDNPPKAMLVGLAAELLVVPVFVLTVIVLVVTLIGIPLLLLTPFAVLMLLLLALVGFSGTAYAVGQSTRRRFGMSGPAGFADICVGLLVILSPLLLGRVIGVVAWPGNPLTWLLIFTGVAFEFVAWTIGFGAVVMNSFSRWRARRVARTASVTA